MDLFHVGKVRLPLRAQFVRAVKVETSGHDVLLAHHGPLLHGAPARMHSLVAAKPQPQSPQAVRERTLPHVEAVFLVHAQHGLSFRNKPRPVPVGNSPVLLQEERVADVAQRQILEFPGLHQGCGVALPDENHPRIFIFLRLRDARVPLSGVGPRASFSIPSPPHVVCWSRGSNGVRDAKQHGRGFLLCPRRKNQISRAVVMASHLVHGTVHLSGELHDILL